MMSIRGYWYDGKTSDQVRAVLRFYGSGALVIERLKDAQLLYRADECRAYFSDRIANTPRFITFGEAGKFETGDNDAIDAFIKRNKLSGRSQFIHRLETSKWYILLSFAALIGLFLLTGKYGVPITAELIASKLPSSVYIYADNQTLDVLDRAFFKPSALEPEIKKRLRRHFQPVVTYNPEWPLNIIFRDGGERVGANALALPGGTIVFTDAMVHLADNDDELLAVLAHEAGHVFHRHVMRTMIQDSLLAFGLLAITGDASGTSELLLGLPVVLTEMAYSREFEREADRFALEYMKTRRLPTIHFVNLMRRLEMKEDSQPEAENRRWLNYLSTHPETDERLKMFTNE